MSIEWRGDEKSLLLGSFYQYEFEVSPSQFEEGKYSLYRTSPSRGVARGWVGDFPSVPEAQKAAENWR